MTSYQQTETSSSCTFADSFNFVASEGGSPGATSQTVQLSAGTTASPIAFVITPGSDTSWDSGTLTTRLNITSGNTDIRIVSIQVSRYNNSCTKSEDLGAWTTGSSGLSAGVVESSISLSAATNPSSTDSLVVLYTLESTAAHGNSSLGFTSNQLIDAPTSRAATVVLEQADFRARNDDGNEFSATWKAPINTSWSQTKGQTFRLRVAIRNAGTGSIQDSYNLEYSRNGAAFQTIGTGGVTPNSQVSIAESGLVDGGPTTQQITSGVFVPGTTEDSVGQFSPTSSGNITLDAGEITEIEWALKLQDGGVDSIWVPGDSCALRVIGLDSYAALAQFDVVEQVALTVPAGEVILSSAVPSTSIGITGVNLQIPTTVLDASPGTATTTTTTEPGPIDIPAASVLAAFSGPSSSFVLGGVSTSTSPALLSSGVPQASVQVSGIQVAATPAISGMTLEPTATVAGPIAINLSSVVADGTVPAATASLGGQRISATPVTAGPTVEGVSFDLGVRPVSSEPTTLTASVPSTSTLTGLGIRVRAVNALLTIPGAGVPLGATSIALNLVNASMSMPDATVRKDVVRIPASPAALSLSVLNSGVQLGFVSAAAIPASISGSVPDVAATGAGSVLVDAATASITVPIGGVRVGIVRAISTPAAGNMEVTTQAVTLSAPPGPTAVLLPIIVSGSCPIAIVGNINSFSDTLVVPFKHRALIHRPSFTIRTEREVVTLAPRINKVEITTDHGPTWIQEV